MYGRLPKVISLYRGLVSYNEVTVRSNRTCRLCGRTISKGEKCITSFEKFLFKETFDQYYYYDYSTRYRKALAESGKLIRKWQCKECSIKLKRIVQEDEECMQSYIESELDLGLED